jgi:hypothetical protein
MSSLLRDITISQVTTVLEISQSVMSWAERGITISHVITVRDITISHVMRWKRYLNQSCNHCQEISQLVKSPVLEISQSVMSCILSWAERDITISHIITVRDITISHVITLMPDITIIQVMSWKSERDITISQWSESCHEVKRYHNQSCHHGFNLFDPLAGWYPA